MTKRNPGVYQRASDHMWIAVIEAGVTPQGIRRRITVSAKTEAAAVRKRKEKERALGREQAAEIERLRAELERLKGLLGC